jgi:CheY-specific phosphatase CheX
MSKSTAKALFNAAAMTFEELGFMFPISDLDELQLYAQADAAAKVDFEGPFSGTLVVQVCGGILPILTANMLGDADCPSEQMQQDALGELANIICGNLLPEIAGPEEVFHLRAPATYSSSHSAASKRVPAAEVRVGLEQGRADLLLFVDQ